MDTNLTDARYIWTARIQYRELEHGMIVARRNRLLTLFFLQCKTITVLFVTMAIESLIV